MTRESTEAWADLTGLIYADADFSPGGREVALALAWAIHHPAEDGGNPWGQARKALGQSGWPRSDWRIWRALGEDVPWYDSRLHDDSAHYGSCEGPRLRPYRPRRPAHLDRCLVSNHHPHLGECRYPVVYAEPFAGSPPDRVTCGAEATISVTEHDPVTGWERRRWFCTRHRGRAREVREQLRRAVPEPPPPIPNRGGVLPRYFKADWPQRYALAVEHVGGSGGVPYMWEPPYHGVCRDDWPTPGATAIPRRPRLSVVS